MSVFEKVVEIVKQGFGVKDITSQTNFYLDLSADSLDMFDLIFELQEEFDVDFPEDIDEFHTVGSIVVYLEAHGAQ